MDIDFDKSNRNRFSNEYDRNEVLAVSCALLFKSLVLFPRSIYYSIDAWATQQTFFYFFTIFLQRFLHQLYDKLFSNQCEWLSYTHGGVNSLGKYWIFERGQWASTALSPAEHFLRICCKEEEGKKFGPHKHRGFYRSVCISFWKQFSMQSLLTSLYRCDL